MKKVVIAGGTGFIGKALIELLAESGYEPVLLSRGCKTDPNFKTVRWDGSTVGVWRDHLNGASAVINLSGSPISAPWTSSNRKQIMDSRVKSTLALGKAISTSQVPPLVWINGSATGFYGDREDELLDESSPAGSGFLSDVCQAWEQAVDGTPLTFTRVVKMRTGVVLGNGGGALMPLSKLTKAFLGGAAGSGRQWVPWIHLKDLVRLILWMVESKVEGPVNATAPHPVTNSDLMEELRSVSHRPWSPSVPAFALTLASKLGGPDPSVLLDSDRVIPKKAIDAGFEFEFQEIAPALSDLIEHKQLYRKADDAS